MGQNYRGIQLHSPHAGTQLRLVAISDQEPYKYLGTLSCVYPAPCRLFGNRCTPYTAQSGEAAGLLEELPGDGSVPMPCAGLQLAGGSARLTAGSEKLTGNHGGRWSMALPSAVTSSLRLNSTCC